MATRKTLAQLNPVSYCNLHQLPGPNWQYQPMPGCYATQRCNYCAQRSDTVDLIPNAVRNNPLSQLKLKETWLVDCCSDCKHRLQDCVDVALRDRAHYLLVTLRKVQQHTRGARDSFVRSRLDRRIINLTARAKGRPWPLP